MNVAMPVPPDLSIQQEEASLTAPKDYFVTLENIWQSRQQPHPEGQWILTRKHWG